MQPILSRIRPPKLLAMLMRQLPTRSHLWQIQRLGSWALTKSSMSTVCLKWFSGLIVTGSTWNGASVGSCVWFRGCLFGICWSCLLLFTEATGIQRVTIAAIAVWKFPKTSTDTVDEMTSGGSGEVTSSKSSLENVNQKTWKKFCSLERLVGEYFENLSLNELLLEVIDTVEAAVNILIHGFSDFSADCPNQDSPSISVDTSGFHVNFGSLVLEKARIDWVVRLMWQSGLNVSFLCHQASAPLSNLVFEARRISGHVWRLLRTGICVENPNTFGWIVADQIKVRHSNTSPRSST